MQADVPAPTTLPTPNPSLRPFLLAVFAVFIVGTLAYGVVNSGQEPYVVATIFATRFLGIFIEAVPFLLLGTLTSGLIEAFLRPDDLVRFLPRNRYLSTVGGAFLGMVFPVCECGVVPVARRLFVKGLPPSVGIAFLLAAPVLNPIVFASTFIAFGGSVIFVGRFVVTAIVAIAVGWLFALTSRHDEEVLLPASLSAHTPLPAVNGVQITLPYPPPSPRPSLRKGIGQALTVSVSEFFEMGRYLVIGCLLASAMQTLVPQETLLRVGEGTVTSVLAMQVLAFVLSVCSTVDSFLALAFVNTFTTGAILAFLSFGPMVDIKSTLMFLGVFQKRAVFYLILLPFMLNAVAGVALNLWLLRG